MSAAPRLTVEDVAQQLHLSPAWVSRLAAAGEIKADKPGKRWLFTQAYVDAYVAANAPKATAKVERRRRRRAA